MEELQITIKTVSPMLASNDGKVFDLTPQTVRGVMRFWYRAVVPRVIDISKNLSDLKTAETLLFGSTERKSLFDVMVDFDNSMKTNKPFRSIYGQYNTYGVYGAENRKEYLKENANISLDFIIKEKNIYIKDILKNLILLISYAGGFGAKSRKGFGSFDVIKINGKQNENNLKFKEILSILDESIMNFIKSNENNEFKFNFDQTKIDGVADFPMLIQDNYKIFKRKKTDKNFKDLYNYLYRTSRNEEEKGIYLKMKSKLRKHNGIDSYSEAKRLERSKNESDIVFYQSMLGLPINYDMGKYTLKRGDFRKASPLFISVHKDKTGYYPRFLIVKSKLYDHGNEEPKLTFGRMQVFGSEEFDLIKEKILEVMKSKK